VRFAVLSDVHANREAFAAVLDEFSQHDIDQVVYLGDIVGYNPDPNYCIERLFALTSLVVRGNHDRAVAGQVSTKYFNQVAEAAVVWTRRQLTARNLIRLENLRAGPILVEKSFLICHGSPRDEDEYIFQRTVARENFDFMGEHYPGAGICFFGHTHVPMIIDDAGQVWPWSQNFRLEAGRRYLINPGSVGQPRDGNDGASWGIYDDVKHSFRHLRVNYPLEETQRKIFGAGLPEFLALRLAAGR
jgi:predicted phosphodiesterase